jgi:hypothetical protein
MLRVLLDAAPAINGMNDVTFTLGNLITIGGGIVGVTVAAITLRLNMAAQEKANNIRFKTLEKEYDSKIDVLKLESEKDNKNIREDLISVKSSKRAQKAEFMEIIKEKDEATRSRIDSTQKEIKELTVSTNDEFKSINNNISEIKSGNARIEGMLTQILNSKN